MMIVIFKVSRKELLLFWNLGQLCLDNGIYLRAFFREIPRFPFVGHPPLLLLLDSCTANCIESRWPSVSLAV